MFNALLPNAKLAIPVPQAHVTVVYQASSSTKTPTNVKPVLSLAPLA